MHGGRIRHRTGRLGRVASSCLIAAGLTLLGGMLLGVGAGQSAQAQPAKAPSLSHVFVIVEENNGYHDVIGNPAAPNLTYLAKTFGVATDYFGVSPCCSEPNYVGLLGGSTFNVTSDDAYWKNTVNAPSLISQLDKAGISWKAYLQALPYPGYEGICYPAKCNGAPDSDPLFVSKHDGIQNYTTSQNPADWSRQVPIGTLAADLRSGNVPAVSYVVPDECHDMHGDPPYCLDSGNIGDPQNQHLVAVGDAYLGQLVSEITHASFWAQGNNAIAITFDEGDNTAGCCDANPGAGQVALVVITSHGPRGLKNPSPANHYSLLSTIQHNFGLGCLQFTCDTKHVKPLTSMFAVAGTTAIATTPLPERFWATPTPGHPPEPTSITKATTTAGGWTVQKTQLLGTSDNSVGAIAGSSPTDIWAVGDFLPDAAKSNQDATLTFAEHYNGSKWTVVRTPNTGPDFNSFYGLAASQGRAWAVGERLNSRYQDRALVEVWNGTTWSLANIPQPGDVRDMLFAATALSPSDVWVVGDQEGGNGVFQTLAEHWNGSSWTVVPTPDPGPSGDHLYAVDAVSPDDVWATGQQLGRFPDNGLVEHWDGHSWSVVPMPAATTASVMLDAIAVTASDQVYVAGEADSPAGGRPLIETYQGGTWQIAGLPASAGSIWTNLWGITVAGSTVWAVGTYVDPKTDNNNTLILSGTDGVWTVNAGPEPASGSNILGGVTTIGGRVWAAGIYDDGGSRLPLVEHR
jgi:Phosphoesterase family